MEQREASPSGAHRALVNVMNNRKQGLTLRQGSLSKYSTLTRPSLKDALHLKDQFVCSLGDGWHITVALDAVHPANLWCASLVSVLPLRACLPPPQLLNLLLLQLCVPAVPVHLSCCLLPSPLLTTSFLLLPGKRRAMSQRDDDFSTSFGEPIL